LPQERFELLHFVFGKPTVASVTNPPRLQDTLIIPSADGVRVDV